MDEHEREFMRRTLRSLAPSMAIQLRHGVADVRVIEDGDRLTAAGRMWVRGYLAGRLSTLRAETTGRRTLSCEDLEDIAALVERSEKQIVAEIYC